MSKTIHEFFKPINFHIIKGNQRCLLYGLNDFTKRSLLTLVEESLYIDGFLLSDEESDASKISYLNKPMYLYEDIRHSLSKYVIVDVFGLHAHILKNQLHCNVINYLEPCSREPVLVYGAGERGKKAYQLLSAAGIEIIAYSDRDIRKQGELFCGLPVLAPSEMKRYMGKNVIVALEHGVGQKVAAQMSAYNCYVYESDLFHDALVCGGTSSQDIFKLEPMQIYYHIHKTIDEKIKTYFWGKLKNVIQLRDKLAYLDIRLEYAIDDNGFVGIKHNVNFCHPEQVLQEPVKQTRVVVLPECKVRVREYIKNHPLRNYCFAKEDGILQLYHAEPLDPSFGYNVISTTGKDIVFLRSSGKNSKKNIGILGDSTADITHHIEKSWPETLVDIAGSHNLDWVIYAGGTAGYLASETLIKFIRDMAQLKIDTLISYSRSTELVCASTKNLFISQNQQARFRQMASKKRGSQRDDIDGIICYGHREQNPSSYWFCCEQMLYAICKEYGIQFYSIIAPVIFEKKGNCVEKRAIIEHLKSDMRRKEYLNCLNSIRDVVKKNQSVCPWLIDLTEIFDEEKEHTVYIDHCHLTSYGNELVAMKIFELLNQS